MAIATDPVLDEVAADASVERIQRRLDQMRATRTVPVTQPAAPVTQPAAQPLAQPEAGGVGQPAPAVVPSQLSAIERIQRRLDQKRAAGAAMRNGTYGTNGTNGTNGADGTYGRNGSNGTNGLEAAVSTVPAAGGERIAAAPSPVSAAAPSSIVPSTPAVPETDLAKKRRDLNDLMVTSLVLDKMNAKYPYWKNYGDEWVANQVTKERRRVGLAPMAEPDFQKIFRKKGLGDVEWSKVADVFGATTVPQVGKQLYDLVKVHGKSVEEMDFGELESLKNLVEAKVQGDRPAGWTYNVGTGVVMLPPFAVEIGLTGGLTSIVKEGGKEAAKKGLRAGIEAAGERLMRGAIKEAGKTAREKAAGGFVTRTATEAGKALAYTAKEAAPVIAVTSLTKVPAMARARAAQTVEIMPTDDGKVTFRLKDSDVTFGQAYVREFINNAIQYQTEYLGGTVLGQGPLKMAKGVFAKLPARAQDAIANGVMGKMVAKLGTTRVADLVKRGALGTQWQGYFPELMEEFAGQAEQWAAQTAGEAAGVGEYTKQDVTSPILWGENLATTMAVLAIPTGFWGGMSRLGQAVDRNRRGKELGSVLRAGGVENPDRKELVGYVKEMEIPDERKRYETFLSVLGRVKAKNPQADFSFVPPVEAVYPGQGTEGQQGQQGRAGTDKGLPEGTGYVGPLPSVKPGGEGPATGPGIPLEEPEAATMPLFPGDQAAAGGEEAELPAPATPEERAAAARAIIEDPRSRLDEVAAAHVALKEAEAQGVAAGAKAQAAAAAAGRTEIPVEERYRASVGQLVELNNRIASAANEPDLQRTLIVDRDRLIAGQVALLEEVKKGSPESGVLSPEQQKGQEAPGKELTPGQKRVAAAFAKTTRAAEMPPEGGATNATERKAELQAELGKVLEAREKAAGVLRSEKYGNRSEGGEDKKRPLLVADMVPEEAAEFRAAAKAWRVARDRHKAILHEIQGLGKGGGVQGLETGTNRTDETNVPKTAPTEKQGPSQTPIPASLSVQPEKVKGEVGPKPAKALTPEETKTRRALVIKEREADAQRLRARVRELSARVSGGRTGAERRVAKKELERIHTELSATTKALETAQAEDARATGRPMPYKARMIPGGLQEPELAARWKTLRDSRTIAGRKRARAMEIQIVSGGTSALKRKVLRGIVEGHRKRIFDDDGAAIAQGMVLRMDVEDPRFLLNAIDELRLVTPKDVATQKGVIEAGDVILGSTQTATNAFGQVASALVKLFRGANPTTFVEEMYHVWFLRAPEYIRVLAARHFLDAATTTWGQLSKADQAAVDEAVAEAGLKWYFEGRAQSLPAQLMAWMKRVAERVKKYLRGVAGLEGMPADLAQFIRDVADGKLGRYEKGVAADLSKLRGAKFREVAAWTPRNWLLRLTKGRGLLYYKNKMSGKQHAGEFQEFFEGGVSKQRDKQGRRVDLINHRFPWSLEGIPIDALTEAMEQDGDLMKFYTGSADEDKGTMTQTILRHMNTKGGVAFLKSEKGEYEGAEEARDQYEDEWSRLRAEYEEKAAEIEEGPAEGREERLRDLRMQYVDVLYLDEKKAIAGARRAEYEARAGAIEAELREKIMPITPEAFHALNMEYLDVAGPEGEQRFQTARGPLDRVKAAEETDRRAAETDMFGPVAGTVPAGRVVGTQGDMIGAGFKGAAETLAAGALEERTRGPVPAQEKGQIDLFEPVPKFTPGNRVFVISEDREGVIRSSRPGEETFTYTILFDNRVDLMPGGDTFSGYLQDDLKRVPNKPGEVAREEAFQRAAALHRNAIQRTLANPWPPADVTDEARGALAADILGRNP